MILESIHTARFEEASFRDLQWDLWAWQDYNFGTNGPNSPPRHMFLGMCEEAGELVHGVLKLSQGIRGTREEHIANIKDAIGDIGVYLMNFYHRAEMGFLESNSRYFIMNAETDRCTNIQLENLAWKIFRDVAEFGVYFEPSFNKNEPVEGCYHRRLQERTRSLFDDLSYLANILHTSLYTCIHTVYTQILMKRDWKANPTNGVTV